MQTREELGMGFVNNLVAFLEREAILKTLKIIINLI